MGNMFMMPHLSSDTIVTIVCILLPLLIAKYQRLYHMFLPFVMRQYLSRDAIDAHHRKVETARKDQHNRHLVQYFHQIDDPYGILSIQALTQLAAKYDIDIQVILTLAAGAEHSPQQEMLTKYR